MGRKVAVLLFVCWASVLSLPLNSGSPDAGQNEELTLSGERRINFNAEWRFLKGEAEGAERADFADAQWRLLDLPHDWAIEGPFDRKYNPHSGGLPFYGVGWYRKHFVPPAGAAGKYFSIEFDGAMANSRIWLNGQELGGRPYGPYRLALTFQDEAQARNAVLLPGAELLSDAATVQIRANDFEEGYRQSLRLISLAGIIGRLQAYQAVTAAQPDAEASRLRVSDWLSERWLNQLPPGAPPSGAKRPVRYWGAR